MSRFKFKGLKTCSEVPRLKSKENISNFWKKNGSTVPELYKLAGIILTVSCNQVNVDYPFSSLKYILSYLRCNLWNNCTNNILLIRANSE